MLALAAVAGGDLARVAGLGPWWGLLAVTLLSRLHDRLAAWPWWELTALMATEMQLLFSLVTSYLAPCLRVGPFLEQVEAF